MERRCEDEFDPRADTDGDGLLDVWEGCGFDPDGDGPISKIDLPGFGANPRHKDLFLELDWVAGQMPSQEPTRAAIQALKGAFAVAPIDAGTEASKSKLKGGVDAKPNPDGRPGINLWVDTGGLKDSSGNLVGDNLGGGNPITPAPDLCPPGDGDKFNTVKSQNFDSARSLIFRYGISSPQCTGLSEDGAGPNTCTDGRDNGPDGFTDGQDPNCGTISWAELGGNDLLLRDTGFVPAVIMHELGHNLNLHHGGDEKHNCKPNYVSVMNYSQSGVKGIRQSKKRSVIAEFSSFNEIIDYSPPRFGIEEGGGLGSCADGRDNGTNGRIDADDPDCLKRGIPSFTLKEDMLDESMILDPGTVARLPDRADAVNQFVFANPSSKPVIWPLNGDRDGDGKRDGVDWNGNGRPPLVEDGCGITLLRDGTRVPLIPGTCGDGFDNGNNVRTCGSGGPNGNDGLSDALDPDCTHDALSPLNVDNISALDDCKNSSTDSELTRFDDWLHISLPFRQFADSADGVVIPPPPDEEPTLEQLMRLEQELNSADLAIDKDSDPDEVKVGQDFRYVLTVTNKGPNPAARVEVNDALPSGVSPLGDTPGCVLDSTPEPTDETSVDTLVCDLGALLPNEQRQIEIAVSTAGVSRLPSITNMASVENITEFAGPDPEPSDNFATVTTTFIPHTPTPTPTCNELTPTIFGTEDDDVLRGTAGPDVIHGLGGDDLIRGKGGNDVICGGRGNDRLRGGRGSDLVLGGSGSDMLFGGENTDTCDGGHGMDKAINCETVVNVP